MKILARHKWVAGCTITEMLVDEDKNIRRYVATIRGFRNWLIYEGKITTKIIPQIINQVKYLRNKINSGNEEVFFEKHQLELNLDKKIIPAKIKT